ncbi:hypothetical protein BDE02_04G065000 [Populus trichocarpa]|nr:hypothetical protein BDE02_04G065000 [Populus trichocarpa]
MQVHQRNILAEMMSVLHQHFQRSNASPFHPLKSSSTSTFSLCTRHKVLGSRHLLFCFDLTIFTQLLQSCH